MAIQSLTDLKALINSTIQDNTTNDISGSDVQTALINAIDTLDSLEGFINVHKANGQTTITAYGSKALARAAVPDDCKKEGVVIAYKLSTGWLIEQNLDATAGTWGDDASWQTIGPVSVSQNTLTIGGEEKGELAGNTIENDEFLKVITDKNGCILIGIRKNGDIYYGVGMPSVIRDFITNHINELLSLIQSLDSEIDEKAGIWDEQSEFIKVVTDRNNHILYGVRPNGTVYIPSLDNPLLNSLEPVENSMFLFSYFSEESDNVEWYNVTIDSNGKILEGRRKDGVKVENVGLLTNKLLLTETGLSEFEQTLKEHGFTSGQGDWTDEKSLKIAEPRCAIVNFSGIDNMPQEKYPDADRPRAYMQFWDMNGNYFKKEVLVNAQGRSTLGHPKKNIAIDICNNNGWDDSDTFSLQIEGWVPQDSFHLKAFYNDPFRCLSPVAYKLNDEILKTRGGLTDYVWKKALIDLDSITPTSTGVETAEDAIEEWSNNARCFPMGFPCIVYLDGFFYGIYSWQLKKARENYRMSKKKPKHIHLDGLVNLNTILSANGDKNSIVWTTNTPEGIEIRNPKPKLSKDGWQLTLMDGNKYDADNNGGELIDDTSSVWDSTNESHIKTAQVKQYILNLSTVIPTLSDAFDTYEASEKTAEDKAVFKAVFETYFDVDNLIDYLILSDVLNNYDGFSQNVQWITYDGVKWYLCAYDLDGVMGNWWELNDTILSPKTTHFNYAQFKYIPIFYNIELEERYSQLRKEGLINTRHIISLVEDWIERVGSKEIFEKEWKKWPSFIKNDTLFRLEKWLNYSISNMDSLYEYV